MQLFPPVYRVVMDGSVLSCQKRDNLFRYNENPFCRVKVCVTDDSAVGPTNSCMCGRNLILCFAPISSKITTISKVAQLVWKTSQAFSGGKDIFRSTQSAGCPRSLRACYIKNIAVTKSCSALALTLKLFRALMTRAQRGGAFPYIEEKNSCRLMFFFVLVSIVRSKFHNAPAKIHDVEWRVFLASVGASDESPTSRRRSSARHRPVALSGNPNRVALSST